MSVGLESQFGKLNLDDEYAKNTVLVSNLPPNSWIESFAMRPNGDGLGARLDGPELYYFNGEDLEADFRLAYTFPEDVATGVINIHALLEPDEFAVITGFVNMAEVRFENFSVWRVKLHPEEAEPPVVTKIADLPETGFSLGVVQPTERTLLIGDSAKACIWRLDIATGRTEVLIEESMMAPAGEDDFFGLNRMRLAGGYVWFTNSSVGLLGRFPVAIKEGEVPEGEWDVEATGGVDIIAADIEHCDGLAINADQTAAFCVAYLSGVLWKVDIDKESGRGTTSVIMENVVSPTGVEIVYQNGKPKIYVMCCGQIEAGWSRDEDRVSWSDIANINNAVSVEVVTVTEEVAERA